MSWARGEVVGKWKGCSSFGFDALARPQLPRPSFSLAEIQSLAVLPICHSLPRMFFPVLHAIKPFFMKRLSLAFPFQLKPLLHWLIVPCTSIQVITLCVCVCVCYLISHLFLSLDCTQCEHCGGGGVILFCLVHSHIPRA